jgi:hypothetical protein
LHAVFAAISAFSAVSSWKANVSRKNTDHLRTVKSRSSTAQGVPGLMSGVAGGTATTLGFLVWIHLDGKEYPRQIRIGPKCCGTL